MNTIPLKEWDVRAMSLMVGPATFKTHDDIDSLAGRVCICKRAAKDAVMA